MKLMCILSLTTICAVTFCHGNMKMRKRRNLVYLRGAMVQTQKKMGGRVHGGSREELDKTGRGQSEVKKLIEHIN
ncbi:hypothetical protein C0J52_05214 [Blattella germanica]|nr:hypothetical protein C0J52_05214 [Blattella germanica]